ncbi:MAG: FmdB family zinc ribbon protein [Pseudomonadota bacterium]|nr:FmdB family zinc ribbon protein [Pseudomonadota bacterium]
MPLYDYHCPDCGLFEAMMPLATHDQPSPCPACAAPAPRVMIHAPRLSAVSTATRIAHETNERSADSPKRSSHGPGCGCCGGASKARQGSTLRTPDGAKSFPAKRPWMISH